MRQLLTVIFMMLFSSQVWAHSDIAKTMPKNEAILEAVPEEIIIHMGKPIRLTKVEMQHEDHEILELDTSDYKGFETKFTLPIEPMGTGIYVISWRALGQDGHAVQGELTFTVME